MQTGLTDRDFGRQPPQYFPYRAPYFLIIFPVVGAGAGTSVRRRDIHCAVNELIFHNGWRAVADEITRERLGSSERPNKSGSVSFGEKQNRKGRSFVLAQLGLRTGQVSAWTVVVKAVTSWVFWVLKYPLPTSLK